MTDREHMPAALRAALARNPRPVRPLVPAWRRVSTLVPWAALLVLLVTQGWGIREDAPRLGVLQLWGWSLLELAFALVVAGAAVAEAIPGHLPSRGRTLTTAAGAGLVLLAITLATHAVSPGYVPAAHGSLYFWTCLSRPFLLGLPALAVLRMLAARGLVSRPVLAGALAGLAAGLMSDASWRLYCDVSDPSHVLAAHAGAVGALTLLGAAGGALALRRSRSRMRVL
jgi:hypothetical protein